MSDISNRHYFVDFTCGTEAVVLYSKCWPIARVFRP